MKLPKLKVTKVCYNKVEYNNKELDADWTDRNNINQIIIIPIPFTTDDYEKIIIEDMDNNEIVLKTEEEIDNFFQQHE